MSDNRPVAGNGPAVQMIKFASVGVINTLVDFSVFVVLHTVFGLDKIAANTVAFLLAVINSYVINRRWTFAIKSSTHELKPMLAFIALNAVGLLISNLSIYLLSPPLHVILAKIVATFLTFIWNFTTSRFVFVRKRRAA